MAMREELRAWIDQMVQRHASDLILTEGQPPILRVLGELEPMPHKTLTAEDVGAFVASVLSEEHRRQFAQRHELDTSFGLDGHGRFRVNVFQQQGSPAMVIRLLPQQIPTMASLGVPGIVTSWLDQPHGLIVTTGPTGSGKSTSQAAMIQRLNERRRAHIITIEDPVEYKYRHGTCTIQQREVGTDTESFTEALRRVFRQSPDVIVIGEMRDRETFEAALQLAETGHLVLATLHTGDAMQAISRIIDVFPAEQQQQIRVQLALTLVGIVVQQLMPTIDGKRRVLATEVMQASPAVRNLIKSNELPQLYSVIQTSTAEGMHTMNMSLLRLFQDGRISLEQARLVTTRPKEFEQMVVRSGAVRAGR